MFEAEADGLAALAETGSIRVPQVVCTGVDTASSWLVLEFLALGRGRGDTSAAMGEALARLHGIRQRGFGWQRDNYIGTTPQPNGFANSWPEFYARQRLEYQLDLASGNGLRGESMEVGQRLIENLYGLFTDYQPEASLLHGDLWGGNAAALESGEPVLFDPAVYIGDREADLAMTELFGGFSREFYAAYDGAWPLDVGYAVRKNLYNLYHVLNHYNLFGGGYGSQAASMMRGLLAELI